MSIIQLLLFFILGILLWTFTEYVLHRFLGHVKTKFLVRTRFHKEHSKHHLKRHYFAGVLDKSLTLMATTPIIFGLCYLFFGPILAASFTVGFTLMYLSYELIHLRMHVNAPPHYYASYMRAHHFYHHFVDESMNHGVTTPLWDLVFGTYRKPSTIPFPEKFRLSWINVNEAGKFRDQWGQQYQKEF